LRMTTFATLLLIKDMTQMLSGAALKHLGKNLSFHTAKTGKIKKLSTDCDTRQEILSRESLVE